LQPRIAVVTVLYRSAPFVRALLESVAAVDYPRDRLELHLVDNGPGDGSLVAARAEMDRLGDRLPQVLVHEPGRNEGFAGGNNVALRSALGRGVDFSFLLNPDATFERDALRAAVSAAGPGVGSVQSLVVLADDPEVVNTSGNFIHYLGFGYAGGYRRRRADVAPEVQEITFSSGAAVLLPRAALLETGLLDETLWLYHEDLDLGWRLRLCGYRNVLAPASVCRHRYEFSKSSSKWYWLERNRWLVVLKNYRLATVLLLLPFMIASDAGILLLAARGGWLQEKLRAMAVLARPATWTYLARERRRQAPLRRVGDRDLLRHFTPVIAHADVTSERMSALVAAVGRPLHWALRQVVRW
jgi:GT2 family glycosyltransferase